MGVAKLTEVTIRAARATGVRYRVLALVCSLSIITYLDRVCISGSAPFITRDLHLDPAEMGLVFGAFALAYALFEVPSGWLGDRIGPRKVMTRIVLWWSVFTTVTGVMRSLWSMVVVRFLFGAGEAGAYPNTTKVISRWMPTTERGFAQGMVWMCGRMGGALAPGLVVLIIGHIGWRKSFWVFGVLGVLWAAFFWVWFRDNPQDKAGVNESELERISRGREASELVQHAANVPWLKLMFSGNLWAICWMYFCVSYGWYFYITWLPTYLKARGLSIMQAGLYGGLPLFMGSIGCALGGFLTDYVVKRTGDLRSRRYIGFSGFLLGTLCMFASVWIKDARSAVITISMASFFGDMTMGSSWAVCLDVGRDLAGTVSGCMNCWGNLGGVLFPIVTGLLVQHYGDWNLPIIVSATIFFMGALLWLRIDPTKPVTGSAST